MTALKIHWICFYVHEVTRTKIKRRWNGKEPATSKRFMGKKIGPIEYSRIFTNNKLMKWCMQIRLRYSVRWNPTLDDCVCAYNRQLNCERVRGQFNTTKPQEAGLSRCILGFPPENTYSMHEVCSFLSASVTTTLWAYYLPNIFFCFHLKKEIQAAYVPRSL